MFVGCLEVTLSIPEAQSLKDKRSVVRRSIDRARNALARGRGTWASVVILDDD